MARNPDDPQPHEILPLLETQVFGRDLVYLPQVDSTNRLGAELAEAGRAEGTAVIADEQTAGRGRLGRTWHSPPGVNLYMSVILRPRVPARRVAQLSPVMALAVASGVHRLDSRLRVGLKWPNDLWMRGRKLGGILCETRSDRESVHFVVAGVGLNVNASAADFPESLRKNAISLRMAAGRKIPRAPLAAAILLEMERAYYEWRPAGFASLRSRWRELDVLRGRSVRVALAGEEIRGEVIDISSEGSLLIEMANGRWREIHAGDVTLVSGRR